MALNLVISMLVAVIVAWQTADTHPQIDMGIQACSPTPDSLRTPPDARLEPGRYWLTVVAVGGSRAGTAAVGSLLLWPTTPEDRSPRTGERAIYGLGVPLIGTTDVDLLSVGAPLGVDPPDPIPAPASLDPVYPGVVVLVQNWQRPELLQQYLLVIGTFSNIRLRTGWLDGPGIGLWVRRMDASGFYGTWGPFGLVRDGYGFYCAVRPY